MHHRGKHLWSEFVNSLWSHIYKYCWVSKYLQLVFVDLVWNDAAIISGDIWNPCCFKKAFRNVSLDTETLICTEWTAWLNKMYQKEVQRCNGRCLKGLNGFLMALWLLNQLVQSWFYTWGYQADPLGSHQVSGTEGRCSIFQKKDKKTSLNM